jgi:hypothetical protein
VRAVHHARSIDSQFAVVWLTALIVTPLGWIYYLPLAAGPIAARLAAGGPVVRRPPKLLLA